MTSGHLHYQAEARDGARSAPDVQPIGRGPDAQMNSGAFDSGRHFGEQAGFEREGALQQQGVLGFGGRNERERDFRNEAFLAPQAGPEGRVHHGLDGRDVGESRQGELGCARGFGKLAREIRVDLGRDNSGGGVGGLAIHA